MSLPTTDFSVARKVDDLKALPLRAQTKERASVASDQRGTDFVQKVNAEEACDLFLRSNGLSQAAFRVVESDFAELSQRSVHAPHVGHPFLDALLAAHEQGAAFVVSPADIWDLVWRAVSLYLHQYETTGNRLSRASKEFGRSPDGTMRICLSTLGHVGYLKGRMNDQLWSVVREHLVSATESMSDTMTSLGVPHCTERCIKDDAGHCTLPAHDKNTLNLDQKSTKMPPVNLIAEQRTLPTDDLTPWKGSADSAASGIERLLLRGTLQQWTDLLHAVNAVAEFPTFSAWGTRVLWLLYHFVLHFWRFTPDKAKRVPISQSVYEKLRTLEHAMPLERDLSHFAQKFFDVERDESGQQIRLCGSVLFLFPHEAGYFNLSPPCHPMCPIECIDAELKLCGMDVGAFSNTVTTFLAYIDTPDCDVPLTHVQGTVGWVFHKSKRAFEVASMSVAVFSHTECKDVPLSDLDENDSHFLATNVEEVAREALIMAKERMRSTDDFMSAIDICGGDVDLLLSYAQSSAVHLCENPLQDWPPHAELKKDISEWKKAKKHSAPHQFVKIGNEKAVEGSSAEKKLSTQEKGDFLEKQVQGQLQRDHAQQSQESRAPEKAPPVMDVQKNMQEQMQAQMQEQMQTQMKEMQSQMQKQMQEQMQEMQLQMQDRFEKMQSMHLQMQEQKEAELHKQMKKSLEQMQKKMQGQMQTLKGTLQSEAKARADKLRAQMQKQIDKLREQVQREQKKASEKEKSDSKQAEKREKELLGSAKACEAEIVRIKAMLSDLSFADALDDTGDAKSDCDDAERTAKVPRDEAPAPLPKNVRVVATGGAERAQAISDFCTSVLHFSVRRACNARHFCGQHRDFDLAPTSSLDNFYDRIASGEAHFSLFELFVAIADQEMQCERCEPHCIMQGDQSRLFHGGIGDCAEDAPEPLPDFARALYKLLAHNPDSGSAFRSCAVCRRDFADDRFRVAVVVLGVTAGGTVRLRLALRCDQASSQRRCGAMLLQHFDGPERSTPGLALSVSRLGEWTNDVLVRVHVSGDCDERDPHDLLLHVQGSGKRSLALQQHNSLLKNWRAQRN